MSYNPPRRPFEEVSELAGDVEACALHGSLLECSASLPHGNPLCVHIQAVCVGNNEAYVGRPLDPNGEVLAACADEFRLWVDPNLPWTERAERETAGGGGVKHPP